MKLGWVRRLLPVCVAVFFFAFFGAGSTHAEQAALTATVRPPAAVLSEVAATPDAGPSAESASESSSGSALSEPHSGNGPSSKKSAAGCEDLENVFFWLAGGISSPRIQRLASGAGIACRVTPTCAHTLEKAGADATLIHFLGNSGAARKLLLASTAKSASRTCACAGAAAEVAILIHRKNLSGAEEKLHALAKNDPSNAMALFVLGTVLRREERFDESYDALADSAHLMPEFAETHAELSYNFYRTNDSDNALAEARTALSIDPGNAAGYRFLGLAHYADGRYEAALNAFEKSLERAPDNADVYFDMGITQRDKGDMPQAAIAYRHALALRPDFWEAHTNLGVVLRDEGKLDEAVAEYRTALKLKPDEPSVRSNLGNTLCDKEDFDKAIAEFKTLYQQMPDWEGGHNCLARAYMAKRDYPAAIHELRAAIEQNPAGAAEYRVLGQALLLTGQDEEAVTVLRKAVELNPESALGHHYLGTALVNTQDMAGAEKEFREAVRLQPSGQNHYSLAACLMALNRYEEALGELEIASRLDPKESLYRSRMQEAARMITNTK